MTWWCCSGKFGEHDDDCENRQCAPFDATDAERSGAWLVAHSREAIGKVWTAEDHERTVAYLNAVHGVTTYMFRLIQGRKS